MRYPRTFARVLLALTLGVSQGLVAQPGTSGMAFLKLGVSGRGVAMGEAMTAAASGAAAAWFNPAGLVAPPLVGSRTQLMFMHKEWIQDTRTEFLAASVAIDDESALGISLNSTTVSDIEIRLRPGPAEGSFTARDFSLGLSYARSVSGDLQVGLTGKFLYEKILVDETSGFAVDLGVRYRTPVENLTVGAMIGNLGSTRDFRNEKISLPSTLRIGPGYTVQVERFDAILTIASDLVHVFPEKSTYLNAGTELLFDSTFAARGGYQFGSEGRGLSVGIGVASGILALDYAYAHLAADLGNAHTISLTVNF